MIWFVFFFALLVRGLAKVNESECQQCLLIACNCGIMTSRLKTISFEFQTMVQAGNLVLTTGLKT